MTARGFTVIELMIVLLLISVLVVATAPKAGKLRQGTLKTAASRNRLLIRDAIDRFYQNNEKYPSSLDELVSSGLLSSVPSNPLSPSGSWEIIRSGQNVERGGDTEDQFGVMDVTDPGLSGENTSD